MMKEKKVKMEEEGFMEKPLLDTERNQNDEEECRITSVVVFCTLVSVLGSFCSGCSVGFSSASQYGITMDLDLSIADYSLFGSIMTFGGIIGAVFSGNLSDLLGRKRAMWFSDVFCVIGWISIAVAKDYWWLDAGRLSLGIGIGIFSYVIPVYLAEITPKHVRGAFIFANQLLQNCGISFAYIVGNVIHWRKLAILCLVPCILQVIGLFLIPESPRWLASNGEEKEFESALEQLRGQETNISKEAKAIKEMIEQGPKSQILDLFQRRYAPPVIIGVGLMLLQQLSGSTGITYYASSIFIKGGFPSHIGTTVLAVVMIPKSLMGLMLVDKLGRRPLLIFSAVSLCLFSLLLSFSFSMQKFHLLEDLTPILIFIGVLGSIVMFAIGLGGLPWIIMSEGSIVMFAIGLGGLPWIIMSEGSIVMFAIGLGGLPWIIMYEGSIVMFAIGLGGLPWIIMSEGSIVMFAIRLGGLPWIIMYEILPINLKVSAGSLVTFTNWFAGWVMAYTFNFILEWNTAGTFFVFAVVAAMAVLFVWALVPETKGRTLEEIQFSFSNLML